MKYTSKKAKKPTQARKPVQQLTEKELSSVSGGKATKRKATKRKTTTTK